MNLSRPESSQILTPLPAFSDNYLWFLQNDQQALVVDPGDAQPVLAFLSKHPALKLAAILITHHHPDHVGGVAELVAQTGAQVFGPALEKMPTPVTPLVGQQHINVLGLDLTVIDVPGHTAGHIAYFCENAQLNGEPVPLLFCGDTLFSGGCGRLFEGTPAQMLGSLDSLAQLPVNTRVCAAHEYTLSNLRFALAVEPNNAALQKYNLVCQTLRAQSIPTLPSTIGQELAINPFLRSRETSVIQAVQQHFPQLKANEWNETTVFAHLREWKNHFQ
jgi:hydroxyacylglutathione hydrolase